MVTPTGDYQVIYRSEDVYRKPILDVDVRDNPVYTSMVIAEEMVDLGRKLRTFLPKQSLTLGSLTWGVLRATAPLRVGTLPWTLAKLHVSWPKLQNHFFRLIPGLSGVDWQTVWVRLVVYSS